MKRLIFSLLLLSPYCSAAITLLAHTNTQCSGTCTVTTSTINCTGATLLVASFTLFSASTAGTSISDSGANTWQRLTNNSNANANATIAYAYNKSGGALSVGASQTFTITSGNSYPGITFSCFSGTLTSSDPLDQSTSAAGNTSGSITPGQNNEVVITAVGVNGSTGGMTVSGYSAVDSIDYSGAVNEGSATAYVVQTTAAATNPAWGTNNATSVAFVASFKAGAAPPASKMAVFIASLIFGNCKRGGI